MHHAIAVPRILIAISVLNLRIAPPSRQADVHGIRSKRHYFHSSVSRTLSAAGHGGMSKIRRGGPCSLQPTRGRFESSRFVILLASGNEGSRQENEGKDSASRNAMAQHSKQSPPCTA